MGVEASAVAAVILVALLLMAIAWWVRNAKSRLEPVAEEQPILQEVLDLANQQLSSWKITKLFREKGYTNRGDKPFECYQIKRIIDRAFDGATREA